MMVEQKHDVVGYFIDGFKHFVWVTASQNRELMNARPVLINPAHIRYVDGNKIALDNGVNWFITNKSLCVLRDLTSYDVLFEE